MGYIKKSERGKRSKGSGVQPISRRSSFFPSSASELRARFLHKNRHQQYMKSVVMCLFCGKLLRYKSIILIADKLIIFLKIRVAVTVFR